MTEEERARAVESLGDRTAIPIPTPIPSPGWASVPLGEPAVWLVFGQCVYRLDGDPAANVEAPELTGRVRAVALGLLRYCLDRLEQ